MLVVIEAPHVAQLAVLCRPWPCGRKEARVRGIPGDQQKTWTGLHQDGLLSLKGP